MVGQRPLVDARLDVPVGLIAGAAIGVLVGAVLGAFAELPRDG